jgi:hypothetical protein
MRCTVHVDAGYLYAALATRVTGSANRAAITVNEPALVQQLIQLATADSGVRILRILWYDAAKNGIPDPHQRQIGLINSVKLRMGRINAFGEQKGVDLRLGLDLVSLGHNRAAEVAYLISGDDDLTEAVTDAQDLGLQDKLLTIPAGDGRPHAVAANLSLAVDGTLPIPTDVLDQLVTRAARPAPVAARPAAETPVMASARRGPAVIPTRPPVIPPAPTLIRPPVLVASEGPDTGPIPVYSSTTGSTPAVTVGPGLLSEELIAEVAQSVFEVWAGTADTDELERLQEGRPNVPPAIDRILLTDMVTRSGRTEIPTWARFALREAFWAAAGAAAVTR